MAVLGPFAVPLTAGELHGSRQACQECDGNSIEAQQGARRQCQCHDATSAVPYPAAGVTKLRVLDALVQVPVLRRPITDTSYCSSNSAKA